MDFFSWWNWYTWTNLPDAAVLQWRSDVLGKIGEISSDALQTNVGRDKNVAAIIEYIQKKIQQEKESSTKNKEKLNLGPINIDIPISLVFMLFPLIWSASRAYFRTMQTQRILLAIDIRELDNAITQSGAENNQYYVAPVAKSPLELLFRGRFLDMFKQFPSFYTEVFGSMVASLIGAYLVLDLCLHVLVYRAAVIGEYDISLLLVILLVAVVFEVAAIRMCAIAIADRNRG
jgi:hypothetical protein